MKIKLDENLPAEVAELLAGHGHDVHTTLSENLSGEEDRIIFDAAMREDRLLITQDLDFSDIRKYKPGSHPGIVLIRLRDPARRRLIDRILQVLRDERIEEFARCFVVISDRKLRIRKP